MRSSDDLNATVKAGLGRHYSYLGEKIHELAGPLTDEQFWKKPFPFGNSFGHLILHLTGNLNYYIGAQVAGTGYVRDRDREFTETRRVSKKEAVQRFDQAISLVQQSIEAQSDGDWGRDYSALREEDAKNRFGIFLRCASHIHLHIGQMTYLCHELERQRSDSR
jgi:DinB family protein